MATTVSTPQSLFSVVAAPNVVQATAERFQRLSADDRLAVLWFAYAKMGKTITPAAPGVARLQLAEGLLDRVKRLSRDEQLQFMRDLVNRADTPLSRAYGVFTANTRLGFWYELANMMAAGLVVPVPTGYVMSPEAERVLGAIEALDMGQQISVLRAAVMDMGYDALSL